MTKGDHRLRRDSVSRAFCEETCAAASRRLLAVAQTPAPLLEADCTALFCDDRRVVTLRTDVSWLAQQLTDPATRRGPRARAKRKREALFSKARDSASVLVSSCERLSSKRGSLLFKCRPPVRHSHARVALVTSSSGVYDVVWTQLRLDATPKACDAFGRL